MSPFPKSLSACSSLLFCLAMMSCGGGSKPAPDGDFSLATKPAGVALVPGGAGQQISVNAVSDSGFAGIVTVLFAGLPTGVTAQPAMLTLAPGTAQNVTVTAAATAAVGSATLTLTGTSGALNHSVTVAVTISAPPDFTLTVSPTSLAVTAGWLALR